MCRSIAQMNTGTFQGWGWKVLNINLQIWDSEAMQVLHLQVSGIWDTQFTLSKIGKLILPIHFYLLFDHLHCESHIQTDFFFHQLITFTSWEQAKKKLQADVSSKLSSSVLFIGKNSPMDAVKFYRTPGWFLLVKSDGTSEWGKIQVQNKN